MGRWLPLKVFVTPEARPVLWAQHHWSRALRNEPYGDSHAALPRYHENPKHLSYWRDGGEIARWAQLGDVVYCGQLLFGELLNEFAMDAGPPIVEVELRQGGRRQFRLDEVRVVQHNIQGLGKLRDETLGEGQRLGLRTTEELEHAVRITMEQARDWLQARPFEKPVDLELLYELHERVFGPIFTWGGRNRTAELVIGRGEWETVPPELLKACMEDYGEFLVNVGEQLSTINDLGDRRLWILLARIYFRLCEIHPFRDGNGRVSRLLVEYLLARTIDDPAAYVDWSKIRRFGNQTDRAFEAARIRGDLKFLATLIFRAHCKFVGPRHVECPNGLRADLVDRG